MIAIDTETTGLLHPDATELHLQPQIIEIYACKFDYDGTINDEFESLVRPIRPIPEFITDINHITNEMVASAPSFIEIYDELCEFFLGQEEVFAQNCPFDMGMLKYELRRHGLEHKFPWPKNYMCTAQISIPIKNKRLKLVQLHEHVTGLPRIDGAHRAKNDVMAMIKCITWLKENGYIS